MSKTNGEQIKKKIVEFLGRHPEGLTLEDLSHLMQLHRQTVTKYVLELKGAEVIRRRWVGPASLHYLKEDFLEKFSERKS